MAFRVVRRVAAIRPNSGADVPPTWLDSTRLPSRTWVIACHCAKFRITAAGSSAHGRRHPPPRRLDPLDTSRCNNQTPPGTEELPRSPSLIPRSMPMRRTLRSDPGKVCRTGPITSLGTRWWRRWTRLASTARPASEARQLRRTVRPGGRPARAARCDRDRGAKGHPDICFMATSRSRGISPLPQCWHSSRTDLLWLRDQVLGAMRRGDERGAIHQAI